MIPRRRGFVTFIALSVAILALLWLFAYLWAGHSLSSIYPLTNATHQKVEELLGEALGQKVHIGEISSVSSNRLILESVSSGEYSPGEGRGKLPLSFHIPRLVITVNLWRYLWDGKVSSIQVQLDRPDVVIDGAISALTSGANVASNGFLPVDLLDVELQIVIKKGRFTYIDGATQETVLVDPVGGTLEIGKLAGRQLPVQQIRMAPVEIGWGPTRLRFEGRITAKEDEANSASVDLVITTSAKGHIGVVGNIARDPAPQFDLAMTVQKLSLRELAALVKALPLDSDIPLSTHGKPTFTPRFGFDKAMDGLIGQALPDLQDALNGTMDGQWRLYGRLASPKLDGDFTLARLEYRGAPVGELAGHMETDGGDFTIHDLQGNILGTSITGQGRFTAGKKPHYDLHLAVNGIKPVEVGILAKAWQRNIPQAAIRPLADMQAEIRVISARTGPELEADWETHWQGNKVTGSGVLKPDGAYRLEAHSVGISLPEFLAQFPLNLGGMSITGSMDVAYTLYGIWGKDSQNNVKAHLEGLMVDDMPLGQVDLDGTLDGKQFVVSDARWEIDAGTITLGGKINWGESLDIWMKAPELIIHKLPRLEEQAGALEGTVAVNGTWQGPWMHPIWSATFSGKDVSWVAKAVPGNITIPRVNGKMLGDGIELFPFDLHYGSGMVTVAGTILLGEPTHPLLDLEGTVKRIGYDAGALAGKLSGKISLAGKWPNPSLAGTLRLHQGRLDLAKLGDTTIPVVTLDVPLALELEIDEGLAVTGAGLLDVVAGGSLQINGSVASPEVKGRIDALRGQLVYLGTPFQVVRGWTEFRPYGELNPAIYLEGSAMVKGLPVTLILQGSGADLQPTLRSEQGLSEKELLAMLSIPEKINTALDDGLGQVFRREMRDLLESQFKLHVLGNLERRLQKALGLDELQLDPGLSDGEVRLELGKYISKDVFVAFTQTVYPHLGNQWHMDYKLNHGLRLSTTWDGDGDYQLGIEVRLDF